MTQTIKMALWNANGLSQHLLDLINFMANNEPDIVLISETHFTNRSCLKILNFSFYDAKYPSGRAHGGSAVLVKSSIEHHVSLKTKEEYLQAISVAIEDRRGALVVSADYCPPRHKITQNPFATYFNSLGSRFRFGVVTLML